MPPVELPIEIEERILDLLCGDPVTLRACCLVCSAWVPTARLHLFKVVELRRRTSIIRFLSTLDSTLDAPGRIGVGNLVRELHLPSFPLRFTRRKGVRHYHLLCEIARRLPNVESLDMPFFDWYNFVQLVCPGAAECNLRDAIASVFPFHRLKSLSLEHVTFGTGDEALHLVAAFPSLETLKIIQPEVGEIALDAATLPISSPRDGGHCIPLQELYLERRVMHHSIVHEMLEGLLRAPFEPPLRRLEWWSFGPETEQLIQEWTTLSEIFRRAAETLEEYVFHAAHDGWLSKTDISRHRSLEVLTLAFVFASHNANCWPSIPMFISKINSRDMREVKLQFDVVYGRFHWEFIDWNEMSDALLSLHEKYPTMKISFSFRTLLERDEQGPHLAAGDLVSLWRLIAPVLKTNMQITVVHTSSRIY